MQTVKDSIIPLDKKIVEEHERYIEIYKINCLETNKSYVGQVVSHILNTGKYRKHGMNKRLNEHFSEAFSSKKNQCHYLNNAIRKYGREKFSVELLELCSLEESEKRESFYIINLDTMFPNGYNLKLGTKTLKLSEEGKKRVSEGVYRYYKDIKFERFKNVKIPIEKNNTDFIRPLLRNNKQYGWYVYINGKKADFGGIHITLDLSRKRAEEFIDELKKQYIAKHLIMTGNPLES